MKNWKKNRLGFSFVFLCFQTSLNSYKSYIDCNHMKLTRGLNLRYSIEDGVTGLSFRCELRDSKIYTIIYKQENLNLIS